MTEDEAIKIVWEVGNSIYRDTEEHYQYSFEEFKDFLKESPEEMQLFITVVKKAYDKGLIDSVRRPETAH